MEVILLPVSAIILTSFERIVLILVFMEVILLHVPGFPSSIHTHPF